MNPFFLITNHFGFSFLLLHRTRIENGITYERINEWLKEMTKDTDNGRKNSFSQLLKDLYGNGEQAVEEEELIDEI